ncbi:MAG: methyltransferase domain-containing protein [Gammaproteobacteria bacterium]|nr:methyltransferase domain-containing protein [Gammaproteobacteria bacterium]
MALRNPGAINPGAILPAAVAVALLVGGCAGGPRLDPARSAAMAGSASQAATQTGPELRSEDAVKRPGSRPVPADPVAQAVLAAQANPARPAADRARDRPRQSAAVLTFFRIAPGMTVLDLWSGGGYYTELLSYVVGASGRVVSHNNTPYLESAKDDLAVRFAPGRLPNVERLLAENNQLVLRAGRFDAVLMTNVYHDIYFVDEKAGWPRIDGPKLLAEVFRGMKPGGVLGVTDHAAIPGSPPETGGTLHRIDPGLLKREITAAGFVLEAESDVLVNAEDDRTKSAFDPSVQGRTDQVVLRFRKPL